MLVLVLALVLVVVADLDQSFPKVAVLFELRNQYSKLPALRFSFPSSGTTFERGRVRQSVPGARRG